MIRTIIIDDERLAREAIKDSLNKFPSIQIIDESTGGEDAIDKIESLRPDLLFLDIQMPEKNGFQLLEELTHVPQVIFVTAYDEHALKAFETNALDYLLKPVREERLQEAIKKVTNLIDSNNQKTKSEILSEKDQVFLKDGDKCWFVTLSKIKFFQSEGNYVKVYFDNYKPMILKSLNTLEERLDSKVFFRANRKYIINLKWIENIENWFNGGLMLTLKTGEKIEVSRRQTSKFKELMSL